MTLFVADETFIAGQIKIKLPSSVLILPMATAILNFQLSAFEILIFHSKNQ